MQLLVAWCRPCPISEVLVGGCYRLIDIPMSNCINSGLNKVFILSQFNSASLNRHIYRTYHGNGINFGDGFVELLAATQTQGEAGKNWFQGTTDAVRQFIWLFELFQDWALVEKDHSTSLNGAIKDLESCTFRLPVTGGAKADIDSLKSSISSVVDVMQAMGSSVCSVLSKEGTYSKSCSTFQLWKHAV